MHQLSSRWIQGQDPMLHSSNYSTVGLACDSSPFNDVLSTTNKAHQNPCLNPSLDTWFPSHSSTLGLGCGSSPFNDDASSLVNKSSRNAHLSPRYTYHYHPYTPSTVRDTEKLAVQPVSWPSKGMQEYRKRQADYGHPSVCHESFHHCYTLICHCSHLPCPHQSQQEEGSGMEALGLSGFPRPACCDVECKQANQNLSSEPCRQLSKSSYSASTETEESSLKAAKFNELEKPDSSIQSGRPMTINHEKKGGYSSPNTSSIHCIASAELPPKRTPIATKRSREIRKPISPSRDVKIERSLEDSGDRECRIAYLGKVKKSRTTVQGNEYQRSMNTCTYQPPTCEESKSSNTMLLDKRLPPWDKAQKQRTKPLRDDSRTFSMAPRQDQYFKGQYKAFDKGQRLDTSYCDSLQKEGIKQLSNDWNEVQTLSCQELGNATQEVQTYAKSERLEITRSGNCHEQRLCDSRLLPSSKCHETSDKDNTRPHTTRLNQDKDIPSFTCSAQNDLPTDVNNNWAGYSYDHKNLPKIVAVHTIVKYREENAHRNELRGARRLSSNEKIEWNRLLDDLSTRSGDAGFRENEHKASSSHDKRYSDAIYMQNSGIAEKQWGNKTFLPTKQSAEKKPQALHAKLPNIHVQAAPSETRCTLDKPYSDAPNPWAVPSRSDLGLPPLPRGFAKVSLGQSGPAPPATKIDASLVKTSGKRQNDIGRTVVVDSQYEDDNKGHVEEKWAIKELLPSIYTEKKPQTVHKCEAVETLRRKIVKAEEKIEKEKIIWKKNILYKLKKVITTRLRKAEEKPGERGDIVKRENGHRERGSKMKSNLSYCYSV